MKRLQALVYLTVTVLLTIIPRQSMAEEHLVEELPPPSYRVSLLTCGPSDSEPFMLYGHTALRLREELTGRDLVFNYGLFSFEQPNFLLNFSMGKPLYCLGATTFETFVAEYTLEGRSITEQVLNISGKEAAQLYEYLMWNLQPDNRDYVYNIFYDNCATRVRDLIEKATGGIEIHWEEPLPTFRRALHTLSHTDAWYTLASNLPLGTQTDKVMSLSDAAFLPDYLAKEMDRAVRKDNKAPIVLETREVLPQVISVGENARFIYEPTLVAVILLLVYILFVLLYIYKGVAIPLTLMRVLLYLSMGLCGVLLWFLGLVSHHPHTFPNLNMLLFSPIYLLLLVTMWFSKCKKATNWFYFINFAGAVCCLLGALIGIQTLPQGIFIIAILIMTDHAMQVVGRKRLTKLLSRSAT